MQRPYRTLENGTLEAFSDEEFIEFVAFHYEKEELETVTNFYDVLVHDILRFHAGEMNYQQLLRKLAEDTRIHNEALKRAISSKQDPIKFN